MFQELASLRVLNHVGVTTMKRFDQGHLRPRLEVPKTDMHRPRIESGLLSSEASTLEKIHSSYLLICYIFGSAQHGSYNTKQCIIFLIKFASSRCTTCSQTVQYLCGEQVLICKLCHMRSFDTRRSFAKIMLNYYRTNFYAL